MNLKTLNDNIIRQQVLEELEKKLLATKESNSAFMVMKNGKGEVVDWCLPMSEVLGIIKKIKMTKELK